MVTDGCILNVLEVESSLLRAGCGAERQGRLGGVCPGLSEGQSCCD